MVRGDDAAQLIESTSQGGSTVTIAAVCQPGDTNDDGGANALDITYIELIVAGTLSETPCADANGDGNINALGITAVELLVAASQ